MRNKILLTLLAAATPAMAAPADIVVHDAWIRALPGSAPSGGYFILQNNGKQMQTLIEAQSDACGMLMLHISENKGGMSTMHHVDGADVAPGGTLRFEPGGYHLMCVDARPVIKPGASVPVTLLFKSGEKLTVSFAVRSAAGK
jgi:copper(I)-binding protein